MNVSVAASVRVCQPLSRSSGTLLPLWAVLAVDAVLEEGGVPVLFCGSCNRDIRQKQHSSLPLLEGRLKSEVTEMQRAFSAATV